MTHSCEYMPMTYGTYEEPAPKPVVCGQPAQVRIRVTYFKQPAGAYEKLHQAYRVTSERAMAAGDFSREAWWGSPEIEQALEAWRTAEVDEVVEARSCLDCFNEKLMHSGKYGDFDATDDDWEDFNQDEFEPAYGPKIEILEVL
jgi:hypothetical protein